jgi:hypothetical protein
MMNETRDDWTGRLTFRCPYTNSRIDSGIVMDRASASKLWSQPIRIQCPHCGTAHFGCVGDGELSEAA